MAKKKNKRKVNKKKVNSLVEVCRSFSYKMALPHYENVDFFCSEKSTVQEREAEKTSQALFDFCKSEVIKNANAYLKGKKSELAILKTELLAEIKKWFAEKGDKKLSNYGKELLEDKTAREAGIEEIKAEEKEVEALK